jgi:hypothetical protein
MSALGWITLAIGTQPGLAPDRFSGGGALSCSQKNGGTLEQARTMANQAPIRTTPLRDRRPDDVALDDVNLFRI